MIDPFRAYQLYNAIKLHFSSASYDAVKYNYKTSSTSQSFYKRKDKYFFSKVGKRFTDEKELIGFYVSHFINENSWIGKMLDNDDTYNEWLKFMQSLTYEFESQMASLSMQYESFNDLFDLTRSGIPPIVEEHLSRNVRLETLVILDNVTNFVSKIDKHTSDTIIWPSISLKIKKYKKFVYFDEDKARSILLKLFTK
jgi:hypothetical protein